MIWTILLVYMLLGLPALVVLVINSQLIHNEKPHMIHSLTEIYEFIGAFILWPLLTYHAVRRLLTRKWRCMWCGQIGIKDDDVMRKHIMECEKHPARVWYVENVHLHAKLVADQFARDFGDYLDKGETK